MTISKTLRTITIPLFFVLTSCMTNYHSAGLTGGYSEIITSTDSFLITYKGNSFMSNEKVMKYALKRASELTIQNGFKYFMLTSSVDQTRSTNYSSTQLNTYNIFSTNGVITIPGVTIRIKCFKAKPKDFDVINAQFYLEKN